MPMDFTHMAMLQARAEHDERQRLAQISEIQEKPEPDTVMTTAEARLLIEALDYEDGEVIGRKMTGDDRGAGYQTLTYENGGIMITAGWTPTVKSRDARLPKNPQRAWTAQRPRQIKGYEKA